MTYAAEGNRNTAIRIVNAHKSFAEGLVEIAGISMETAQAVTAFYLKKKLAKLDPVGGRITVKHGAYLDASSIQNAARLA